VRYSPAMEGGCATVLVVDDNASLRLLCRVNLELEGFRVLEAATVAAAQAHLDAGPVEVVLLDLHIGADDGRRLLTWIRATKPRSAVVLLTGASPTAVERIGGADAVVGKPFEFDDLCAVVRRLGGDRLEVR
jgi:two-component system, OmpR family, response regulator